jgi:N-acetylmuramoyl-L-alanine amidase
MSKRADRKSALSPSGSRYLMWVLILMSSAALPGGPPPVRSDPVDGRPVVVIDPGHGGRETGAKRPEGGFEKDLVLYLAKNIAERLGTAYKTVLTRKDDSAMALDARSGKANHLRADLFVCLHAQGGLRPFSDEVRLFTYRKSEGNRLSPETAPVAGDWESRQIDHLEASRAFAREIEKQLYARLPGISVRIDDAPLAVLAGADMPAVLIEAGGLTFYAGKDPENPSRQGAAFIESVAEAIEAFLAPR